MSRPSIRRIKDHHDSENPFHFLSSCAHLSAFCPLPKKRKTVRVSFSFGGLGKSFVWSSVSSRFGRRTFFSFSFALFVTGRRSVSLFVLIWFRLGILGYIWSLFLFGITDRLSSDCIVHIHNWMWELGNGEAVYFRIIRFVSFYLLVE